MGLHHNVMGAAEPSNLVAGPDLQHAHGRAQRRHSVLHDIEIAHSRGSQGLVLSLVSAALFMELLDGTIIATALPQMAKTFNVSAVSLNIGMTAYMLTLAVFIPISGWLADHAGERTVFAAAIGVFTAASVLCGVSLGIWQFTAARVLQGIGGAMMVPVGRLIVLRSTPKPRLTDALARMTWPALAAPVIGAPLGGLITAYASWRWIFFLTFRWAWSRCC